LWSTFLNNRVFIGRFHSSGRSLSIENLQNSLHFTVSLFLRYLPSRYPAVKASSSILAIAMGTAAAPMPYLLTDRIF
jgi:hypothetical protein